MTTVTKKTTGRARPLTTEQLKSVLAQIPEARRRLLVKVTYWHGLRASESIAMNAAHIKSGHVRCNRLKGSLNTCQPYVRHEDPDLDESVELSNLAEQLRGSHKQLLFPGENRFTFFYWFRKAARQAGLPDEQAHPHCLKHSIAHVVIKGGIEYTRQWLGHASLSSTGEYLKVSDEAAHQVLMGLVGSAG